MSAIVAREVTAVSPAPAAPAATPSGAGGWIVAASVLLFAAVVPLLPTNDLKSDATIMAGLLLAAGTYVWWRSGTMPRRSALDAPVLALLAVAMLSTLFSVDRFLSFFTSGPPRRWVPATRPWPNGSTSGRIPCR